MEEQNLNKFQQYIQQNPIIVGIFVFLQIIFIVLIITTTKNVKTDTFEEPSLPISNLEQDLQKLPANSVDVIRTALYDAIADNGGTLVSLQDSDARVKEGTLVDTYFQKPNMHYLNFVVDIPSISQSYQIFHEWSDDKANPYYLTDRVTMVMCPSSSQQIYQNFDCRDKFDGVGQSTVIAEFLGYFNFNYFSVNLDYDDPSTIVISPSVTYDNDETTKSHYINEVKAAVESLGFSPDSFKYHVRTSADVNYYLPLEER